MALQCVDTLLDYMSQWKSGHRNAVTRAAGTVVRRSTKT